MGMHLVRLLLLASVLAGCSSDETPLSNTSSTTTADQTTTTEALAWPSLDQPGACGQLFIYVHSADETHAVTVHLTDVTAEQVAAGYTVQVDLPDPSVDVQALRGVQVEDPLCNDLFGPDYRVDQTWTASEGTIALDVASGTVTVSELRLELDDGTPIDVASFRTRIGPSGG